jgi:hypothetical protein
MWTRTRRAFALAMLAIVAGFGCETPKVPATTCPPDDLGVVDVKASGHDVEATEAGEADATEPPVDVAGRQYFDVHPSFKGPGPVPGLVPLSGPVALPCSQATDVVAAAFAGASDAECRLVDDTYGDSYKVVFGKSGPGLVRSLMEGMSPPEAVAIVGMRGPEGGLAAVWRLNGVLGDHPELTHLTHFVAATDQASGFTLLVREEFPGFPKAAFRDGASGIAELLVVDDIMEHPIEIARYATQISWLLPPAMKYGCATFWMYWPVYRRSRWIRHAMGDSGESVVVVRPDGSIQGSLPPAQQFTKDSSRCAWYGSTGDGTAWRISEISSSAPPTGYSAATFDNDWGEYPRTVTALFNDGSQSAPVQVHGVYRYWFPSQNSKGVLAGITQGQPQLVLLDAKTESYHIYKLPTPSWLDAKSKDPIQQAWAKRLNSGPGIMVDDQQRYWLVYTLEPIDDGTDPVLHAAATFRWGETKHMPEIRCAIMEPGKPVIWRSYPWPNCSRLGGAPWKSECAGISADIEALGPYVRYSWSASWPVEEIGQGDYAYLPGLPDFPWYGPKEPASSPANKSGSVPRTFTRIMTWKAFFEAGRPIP